MDRADPIPLAAPDVDPADHALDMLERHAQADLDAARNEALEAEYEAQRDAAAYAASHRPRRRIRACLDHTGSRFSGP